VQETRYDAAGRVTATIGLATPIALTTLAAAPKLADVEARLTRNAATDAQEDRVYDGDGRVKFTVGAAGQVVKYEYDANGNVTLRRAYATPIVRSAWTVGTEPAPTLAATDEVTRSVYDSMNRAIYAFDRAGGVVEREYDGVGNLRAERRYATKVSTTLLETTTWLNDPAAIKLELAKIVDTNRDERVRNEYDAAGRLAWSADGAGSVTGWRLDAMGRRTVETRYAKTVATGANASAVVASAADRVTATAYDRAGRAVYQVDATGHVVQYGRDKVGNLVSERRYLTAIAKPTTSGVVTEDTIGSALRPSATLDRTTRWAYDGAGRQVFVIDALGSVSEREFDAEITEQHVLCGELIDVGLGEASDAVRAPDCEADGVMDALGEREADAPGTVTSFQSRPSNFTVTR
jgi:YD repeat-containing protein